MLFSLPDFFSGFVRNSNSILVPMDAAPAKSPKGLRCTFYVLQQTGYVDWLLNYRGGSFLIPYDSKFANECRVRGVSMEIISDSKTNTILAEISSPAMNMNVVRLQTAPRIAVYSIKNELVADETDAVMAVMDYAEIPYTIVYDDEVLGDKLPMYIGFICIMKTLQDALRFMWRESAMIDLNYRRQPRRSLAIFLCHNEMDVARRIKAFCAGVVIFCNVFRRRDV